MGNKFGGIWTVIKLKVLSDYLNAYVKVFKNQDYYHLIYLDAFAGTGECDTRIGLIDGSAKRALKVPRFDEYVFIELDSNNIPYLNSLKDEYSDKNIKIINGDCNNEIKKIIKKYNWNNTRALAFLDPYSMELSFDTLRALAATKAFDIWYLFPLGQATRSLRRDGLITEYNESRLNVVFGDSDWKNKLYYENPQLSLFNDDTLVRKDQKEICCYFKSRMKEIFPSVTCPICLRNSNNAPLFLLYFAVSNKSAVSLANKIARHIINKEQTFVCNNPKI